MPDVLSPIALDLRGKNRGELLGLKLALDREISSIRTQIMRVRLEARKTGHHADAAWWSKVHQALRIKGRQSQQVQKELGRLRVTRQRSVESHFLDVVRERMEHDPNFKTWLETARRRAL